MAIVKYIIQYVVIAIIWLGSIYIVADVAKDTATQAIEKPLTEIHNEIKKIKAKHGENYVDLTNTASTVSDSTSKSIWRKIFKKNSP